MPSNRMPLMAGCLALLIVSGCRGVLNYGDVSFDEGASLPGAGKCAKAECTEGQHCELPKGECVCNVGYMTAVTGCAPESMTTVSERSQEVVCEAWKRGKSIADGLPWTATPNAKDCDPGTLSKRGREDVLNRLGMYRWLVGLGPVVDKDTMNSGAMACAMMSAKYGTTKGYDPHNPPPNSATFPCITQEGAATAARSAIPMGIQVGREVPADAIDWLIQEHGDTTLFGHRRWLFNPQLGSTGIGFYGAGQSTGECIDMFDSSGNGPRPAWLSFPPPGFSPVEITSWVWTFHHAALDTKDAAMNIVRASDSKEMPVNKLPLAPGYGTGFAVGFALADWTPEAGETYNVSVTGLSAAEITYKVSPVKCP